jgi:peptide/nickel transport system permease protein
VLVFVAVFDYGIMRAARPDLFPGEAIVPGTAHDVGRAFLHLDLKTACSYPGCPKLTTLFARGIPADLYLLAGSLAIGVTVGIAAGVFCASRPRTRTTRAIEGVASVAYCTPVYVFGMGLLLLFEPSFGLLHAPLFFHPGDYAPPLEDPWLWLRGMLVPWLILAAPLAAICLRVTQASVLETLDEPYIRTARGKGLKSRHVLQRHAAPTAYLSNASLLGAWAPFMVTNMVLVEFVFFVPGVFVHTKRALGQLPWDKGKPPDIPLLQGLALWAAVLVIALSLLSDLALHRLDPRLRANAVPPG